MTEVFTTTPSAGFYATRLIRAGIEVPCMVWFGCPVIEGQRQERAPRWCIAINGRSDWRDREQDCYVPLDALDYWPLRRRISHREYAFMRRRSLWALQHQPDHPAARPWEPIDLRHLPPRF